MQHVHRITVLMQRWYWRAVLAVIQKDLAVAAAFRTYI